MLPRPPPKARGSRRALFCDDGAEEESARQMLERMRCNGALTEVGLRDRTWVRGSRGVLHGALNQQGVWNSECRMAAVAAMGSRHGGGIMISTGPFGLEPDWPDHSGDDLDPPWPPFLSLASLAPFGLLSLAFAIWI
jgi:hypothetical protein